MAKTQTESTVEQTVNATNPVASVDSANTSALPTYTAAELVADNNKAREEAQERVTSFITFPAGSAETTGKFNAPITRIVNGAPYLHGVNVENTEDNRLTLRAAAQAISAEALEIVERHIASATEGKRRIKSKVSVGKTVEATVTSDQTGEARYYRRTATLPALDTTGKPLVAVSGVAYAPVRLLTKVGNAFKDFNGNNVQPLSVLGIVYQEA